MNKKQLSRIVLHGFKSINDCNLEFRNLNVFIGPNGAGKSNFIGFFQMIQQMLNGQLQTYIGRQGGPDAVLHFGRKKTESLRAELYVDNNAYKIVLEATQDNRMMFTREDFFCNNKPCTHDLNLGHFESLIDNFKDVYDSYIVLAMKSWRVYHFNDTGDTALVKQLHGININDYLRPDARNLAAFLYLLKEHYKAHYKSIVDTIKLVAPFFADFFLRPCPNNKDQIELEWNEVGSDIPFKAHHLSDGTLRFICLATLLLQPEKFQPEIIIIDEPEIGLHPYAITLLASLLRSTSKRLQIIVSTQSVSLVNEFSVDDLISA